MKSTVLFSLCLFATAAAHAQFAKPTPTPYKPEIWMMPPMNMPDTKPGKTDIVCAREMFTQPDGWKETRSVVDVVGFADWRLAAVSDQDLRQWLPMLKAWNIKLGLEVGAVKPWGKTGQEAFTKDRVLWDRFQKLGGQIDALAMDEPLACAKLELKMPDSTYAVKETANFIELVRKNYPTFRVGDIEAFPLTSVSEMIAWIDDLQAALKQKGVRGIDFFRVDVDWCHFVVGHPGGWQDIKKIEMACRQRKIPFSFVYWAANHPHFRRLGMADDSTWYIGTMQQGYDYAQVGGKPDQLVVQSWEPAPLHLVPETDQWSFSRLTLDFVKRFAK